MKTQSEIWKQNLMNGKIVDVDIDDTGIKSIIIKKNNSHIKIFQDTKVGINAMYIRYKITKKDWNNVIMTIKTSFITDISIIILMFSVMTATLAFVISFINVFFGYNVWNVNNSIAYTIMLFILTVASSYALYSILKSLKEVKPNDY